MRERIRGAQRCAGLNGVRVGRRAGCSAHAQSSCVKPGWAATRPSGRCTSRAPGWSRFELCRALRPGFDLPNERVQVGVLVEYVGDVDQNPELVLDPGHEPDRRDRLPAQLEEGGSRLAVRRTENVVPDLFDLLPHGRDARGPLEMVDGHRNPPLVRRIHRLVTCAQVGQTYRNGASGAATVCSSTTRYSAISSRIVLSSNRSVLYPRNPTMSPEGSMSNCSSTPSRSEEHTSELQSHHDLV